MFLFNDHLGDVARVLFRGVLEKLHAVAFVEIRLTVNGVLSKMVDSN